MENSRARCLPGHTRINMPAESSVYRRQDVEPRRSPWNCKKQETEVKRIESSTKMVRKTFLCNQVISYKKNRQCRTIKIDSSLTCVVPAFSSKHHLTCPPVFSLDLQLCSLLVLLKSAKYWKKFTFPFFWRSRYKENIELLRYSVVILKVT